MTALASFTDLRRFVIPKWITIPGTVLGLLANSVRGVSIGMAGDEVWTLGQHGPIVGAVDGLLFAVAGLLFGFALFVGLFMLRACGGGDVKLFAAVSAWVGPYHCLWLLVGSTLVMILFGAARAGLSVAAVGKARTRKTFSATKGTDGRPKSRLSAYALPLALTTALLMLWFYRYDLELAQRTEVRHAAAAGGRHVP
jgi:Flp pilus assembly protein protease CpaA